MPVYKDDGNLSYPEATLDAPIIHLDLKGITVGFYPVQINGFQHLPAETFETAGAVGNFESGYGPGVDTGKIAQHKTPERPVNDTNTIQVTGTDNQIILFHFIKK